MSQHKEPLIIVSYTVSHAQAIKFTKIANSRNMSSSRLLRTIIDQLKAAPKPKKLKQLKRFINQLQNY